MSERYSEDEVVAHVTRLTRAQLVSFVEAEIMTPMHTGEGVVYRQIDIVRVELLCELSEDFDLDTDALGVVISLIDQLHGVGGDLKVVLAAVAAESHEVRSRIGEALRVARSGAGD
jgi:chaperone modulatory protein CbpM